MEIIGTNISEKEQKNKRIMKYLIIAIIISMIVSAILAVTIHYLKLQLFKLVIDEKNISKAENMFIINEDNVYVSIKDISSLIGYEFYNGGYKQYSEDEDKCYVECENEICTFEKGSKIMYKTVPGETDYEYFTLDENVKEVDGKLYITISGLGNACNLNISYDRKQNKITIYTLQYITDFYMSKNVKSAASKSFNNQKALLYDLMVIQDLDNTEKYSSSKDINYGVYSLNKNEISVGTKYKNIEFIESTQEFIVTTSEGKVGIITSDGDTKVKPQYDSLKQIDRDLNLYLATINGKQGIIEKNGKILIYPEYDKIGIDVKDFPNNDIKNSYILYNHTIPVKQNNKWGLYDIKGNMILPIEFDGLGCISKSTADKTLNSILVIPDIKGIVVSKIFELEDRRKVTAYGIVNYLGKEFVPTALESIYSVTNNGREEYTMINNGNSFDVLDYIRKNSIVEEDEEEQTNKNERTNEMTNEVSNEQVNEMTNTTQTNGI